MGKNLEKNLLKLSILLEIALLVPVGSGSSMGWDQEQREQARSRVPSGWQHVAKNPSAGGGWRWGLIRYDTPGSGHMLPCFVRIHLNTDSKIYFSGLQEGGHRALRGPSECGALSHALVTCPWSRLWQNWQGQNSNWGLSVHSQC